MYVTQLNYTQNGKNGKFYNYFYFTTIKRINKSTCDDEKLRDKPCILAIWKQPFCFIPLFIM